jgi:hypothetical protein
VESRPRKKLKTLSKITKTKRAGGVDRGSSGKAPAQQVQGRVQTPAPPKQINVAGPGDAQECRFEAKLGYIVIPIPTLKTKQPRCFPSFSDHCIQFLQNKQDI